ncbi:MAG TPA: transglycosylase family protein [Solirubrobacteraceae bacterium]|nr:transglycosylase family protein [Solirubrobacteraceae bacterium]
MQRDLSSPVLWRRSLRASQERRRTAARRVLRERIGRRGGVAAVCALAVMAGGATAHERSSSERSGSMRSGQGFSVAAVQSALGVSADGVLGPATRRAIRSFQRREGLVVDGVVGPNTLAALGLGGGSSSTGSSDGGSGSDAGGTGSSGRLAQIAQCESGGNPGAVSSNGRYRGKYQFSRETWSNLGGQGDPAKASEAEQDRRAATLYAQSGGSAWPNC